MRHPQDEVNITLETMLQSADTALRSGDYDRADVLLNSVERVLEQNGRFIDPLATSYRSIVRKLIKAGYEPQQITLEGNRALVRASLQNTTNLLPLELILRGQEWIILAN